LSFATTSRALFQLAARVEKALVPHHRLVARLSHWLLQQLSDVRLRVIIGGKADGILHLPLFQGLVEFRLDEGRLGAEDYLLALPLLPINLRQQQFFPALGGVDVAGAERGGKAASRLNSSSG
jgi:hypothetical protein